MGLRLLACGLPYVRFRVQEIPVQFDDPQIFVRKAPLAATFDVLDVVAVGAENFTEGTLRKAKIGPHLPDALLDVGFHNYESNQ